jgi:predicted nucleotidyltransferase
LLAGSGLCFREWRSPTKRWAVVCYAGRMRLEDLRKFRTAIDEIARQHGATRLRVFGSVARGTADEGSDVDFLVDLDPDRSLLDLSGLLLDLERLLGTKVDVVTPRGLKQRIRERVLSEAVPL